MITQSRCASASALLSIQAGGVLKGRHRVTLQPALYTWVILYGFIYSDQVSGVTSVNSKSFLFRECFCFALARICGLSVPDMSQV